MAKKQAVDMSKLGQYAFILGIVIAIVFPLLPAEWLAGYTTLVIWIMVVLGVIVGLLNITAKEVNSFLIAAVALVIATSISAQSLSLIWVPLRDMLWNVMVFVSIAAVIVSIKAVIALAETK